MGCNCGAGKRNLVLTEDGQPGIVVGWSVTLPNGEVVGTVDAPLLSYPEARAIIRQNMGGTARRLIKPVESKAS